MKFATLILFRFSCIASIAQGAPEPPLQTMIGAACKVPSATVERSVSRAGDDPNLIGKSVWLAKYTFSHHIGISMSLECVLKGRINDDTFEFISSFPELEYKKVDLANGDVIYQHLGDRGDRLKLYFTVLRKKRGDYDFKLIISRSVEADEAAFPVNVTKAGIDFIQQLTEERQ